jgi:O-antigen ligase
MPWGFLWFVSRVLGFTFLVVLVVCWVFGLALVLLCILPVYLGAPYASFLNKTLITYLQKKKRIKRKKQRVQDSTQDQPV